MAFPDQGDPAGLDATLTVRPSATAPGLLLRAWTEQDIPALVAAHRDSAIRQWLRHLATTAQEAERIIAARRAEHRAGTAFHFAVLETAPDGTAGDLAGGVNLRPNREAASGEVGYWVAAPGRGRGTAPRALTAVCEWASCLPSLRPLDRLELIHSVSNHASCRVADKAGFALTAVLPPLLPDFPHNGHLHIRLVGQRAASIRPS
jgi:RimJ/RimL family protein N-acetyltransferase